MIKGILIDIDNTLYDYNYTHEVAMKSVIKEVSLYFDRVHFINNYKKSREQLHLELKNTASSHNRLLYFQRTLENLNCNDLILAKKLYDIYWNTTLENIELFDGVIDFFEYYKNYKICFLTDLTAHIQYRKLERTNLYRYADFIVTSEEVGVEKPNERMFNLAIKKLQLSPNEVCMIGDSYEKDIIGALNAKIKPFWKTEKKSPNENISIFNNFKELIGKI